MPTSPRPRRARASAGAALVLALSAGPAWALAPEPAPPPPPPTPQELRDRAEALAVEAARLAHDAALLARRRAEAALDDAQRGAGAAAADARAWAGRVAEDAHLAAEHLRRFAQDRLDRAVEAGRRPTGLFVYRDGVWAPAGEAELPDGVVLLVHGMDESGAVWDDLAPALAAAGHPVARLDYPNDQAAAISANALAEALVRLRAQGARRVDIVGHSMGGLLALDVLTRPSLYAGKARGHDRLPDVPRLITLGSPYAGSNWARLQPVGELIELAVRAGLAGEAAALLGFLSDGDGQAGKDLLPSSAFLSDLSARPRPEGVRITAVAGRFDLASIDWAPVESRLAALAGEAKAREWSTKLALAAAAASEALGDGLVPVSSALWPHADERVVVRAGHRGMIRAHSPDAALRWLGVDADPAPAVPLVVGRLAR